jgi:hypothetical protein
VDSTIDQDSKSGVFLPDFLETCVKYLDWNIILHPKCVYHFLPGHKCAIKHTELTVIITFWSSGKWG